MFKIYATFKLTTMINEYIISCYQLLNGMLQIRNFMPFVVVNMCILSRFFAVMCRLNVLMGEFYNLMMNEIHWANELKIEDDNKSTLLTLPTQVDCQTYLKWSKKVGKSKLSKLFSDKKAQNQLNEGQEATNFQMDEELGEPVLE